MTGSVRRLAVVLLALVALLVVNLQRTQLFGSEELQAQPGNRRALVERFSAERGVVLLGDEPVARSVRTDDPADDLAFRRVYPLGTRAAHVVGWSSTVVGTAGIERAYDAELTPGRSDVLAADLATLLGEEETVGDTVRLTLDPAAQAAAERALANRTGAVLALDPRTGAVLAHASSPTFAPEPLADTDRGAALAAWDGYRTDPAVPLLDRATDELYPPGSTFKVVVAAAALEAGLDPSTVFPDEVTYQPPVGQPIGNNDDGACVGGTSIDLATALQVSCNTVFARLAVELGQDALAQQARAFGFDRLPPYELGVAPSRFPDDLDDAQLAQAGIGQFDVRATVLQLALVSAAIANDGVLQRPHVVREVRDDTAALVDGPDEGPWEGDGFGAQAVSTRTADLLAEMMVRVVEEGTGTAAAVPGVVVGGKTGTAQDPAQDSATAWFTGFADDRVAVAVVLPDAGGEGGGTAAAPVARAVIEAVTGGG